MAKITWIRAKVSEYPLDMRFNIIKNVDTPLMESIFNDIYGSTNVAHPNQEEAHKHEFIHVIKILDKEGWFLPIEDVEPIGQLNNFKS